MNEGKPIRVAQVMGKLWAGGVEAVVFNYYREMDKTKIQFDFYYDADSTIEPPQDLIDMGAKFIKVPPYQNLPLYLKTLRKHFKDNSYHLVHSHINTLSVFPLFAAWIEKVPVRIAHNHSVPAGGELKRNALKYFLRLFAKTFSTDYFACSEKAGCWLFGNATFEQGKVLVINNAIDFEKFQNDSKMDEISKKYGLSNKFVVGHIGRFTYAKNHEFLLDIFCEILKKKKNAVLLLVGDGELHIAIVEKINVLGIQDQVILVGQSSVPEIYYSVVDVVILPSIFEGLSLTTIEAQVSGTPIVISTAVPKETNISKNGFVYMDLKQSAEEWSNTSLLLAEENVELLPESKKYDIKVMAPELMEWYLSKS